MQDAPKTAKKYSIPHSLAATPKRTALTCCPLEGEVASCASQRGGMPRGGLRQENDVLTNR